MDAALVNLFIGFLVGILVGNEKLRSAIWGWIRKKSTSGVGKSVGKNKSKKSIDDIISDETIKEYVQWQNTNTREWLLIEKNGDEAKVVKRMPDSFDNVKVIKKFEVKNGN